MKSAGASNVIALVQPKTEEQKQADVINAAIGVVNALNGAVIDAPGPFTEAVREIRRAVHALMKDG